MLRRTAFLGVVLALLPCSALAQSLGSWSAPFNHPLLPNWLPNQPDWDGERKCPFPIPAPDPNRFMAGHMCLIPVGPNRGKVLVWNWMRLPSAKQHWAIVDVTTVPPTFQNFDLQLPPNNPNLFCSGHAWTKDGHLLVAGGNDPVGLASTQVYRFDPTAAPASAWVLEAGLTIPRWYPTVTTLGTDAAGKDLLVVSGGYDFPPSGISLSRNSYEVFDPTAGPGSGTWQVNPLTGTTVFAGPPVNCDEDLALYPRQHLLSSGKLFFSGFTERGYRLDQTQVSLGFPATWEVHATSPFPQRSRSYASCFLFPNLGGPAGGFTDIVVKTGGLWTDLSSCIPAITPPPPPSPNPLKWTEFCLANLAVGDPNWIWFQNGPPLQTERFHHNTVLLPDATVLAVSGNQDPAEFDCSLPVLKPELLNDQPFAWRTLAPGAVRRGYHSTAALLPDGRVLVGGGEKREFDYEVFSPHYLTNGTTRPRILNAPSTLVMNYGGTFQLEYAPGVTVERAVLIAPASLTHHTDMHTRYWEMQTVPPPPPNPNPFFAFQAPANSNQAPRGFYMLFLVSSVQAGANRGTPSVATWVQLL